MKNEATVPSDGAGGAVFAGGFRSRLSGGVAFESHAFLARPNEVVHLVRALLVNQLAHTRQLAMDVNGAQGVKGWRSKSL